MSDQIHVVKDDCGQMSDRNQLVKDGCGQMSVTNHLVKDGPCQMLETNHLLSHESRQLPENIHPPHVTHICRGCRQIVINDVVVAILQTGVGRCATKFLNR